LFCCQRKHKQRSSNKAKAAEEKKAIKTYFSLFLFFLYKKTFFSLPKEEENGKLKEKLTLFPLIILS
jgi:hypothetical protein